ncbi:MAG TPA: hypothetical protein VGE70_02080 [Burkholderiaceae bacterium]
MSPAFRNRKPLQTIARMRRTKPALVVMVFSALCALHGMVEAAEFKNVSQCAIGAHVTDRQNKSGVVVAVDGTLCKVKLDESDKTESRIFWMLRPGGASVQSDDRLVPGIYPCYSLAGGVLNYAFIDIHILSANAYRDKAGAKGTYRIGPAGKIFFENGPLAAANAKLLAGPRIGLNMNGGSFFNTSCTLKK